MLFLQIPAVILESTKMTGDEKILLSYIISLNRQGAGFFGSVDYLERILGIQKPEKVIQSLELEQKTAEGKPYRIPLIENVLGRWQCTPQFWSMIEGSLSWKG